MSNDAKPDSEARDPHDGDYLGNIWGWNLTRKLLVFLIVLGGIAVYRAYYLDVDFIKREGATNPIMVPDTVAVESPR